ncbi:MAG: HD domain-containing protein, partial [Campylobacteraceae bacterium]|nr:HD domain-containing protein [Campylobacteraceae bacterium]
MNKENECCMSSDVFMIQQEIIEMFSNLVEEKDVYTAGHSKRVAMYSAKLAEALGLSDEEQTTIYQAGLLHDVGKVLTPESILLKPRKFNHREYEIIKRHAIDGERIVSSFSAFAPFAKIILHHHERFDGNGYPEGLKGDEIPLLSRIMAVADVYDALTSQRVY